MPYIEMASTSRTDFDPLNPNTGAIYSVKVVVGSGLTSDEYISPIQSIYAISLNFTGTGIVYFTNDSPATIRAGTAVYAAWDGSSEINLGVTGFYVESTTGEVTLRITVKTGNS